MSSRIFAPGLLDGQVAIVSGAGEAVAAELEALGARVVTCAISEDENEVDAFVDGVLEGHGADRHAGQLLPRRRPASALRARGS